MTPALVVFFILAVIAVGASLYMIATPNPVRSALALVVTFLCVAVYYITLSAQYLAFVQIIVYAGAIMVLFLFVIMLLNLGAPQALQEKRSLQPLVALVLCVVLLGVLLQAGVFFNLPRSATTPAIAHNLGTVESVGRHLYAPYEPWLFPFELTSVLLLAAMMGAIVMAKRKV